MSADDDQPLTRREFDIYKEDYYRALVLQAKEYERRLEDLNSEHARIERIVQKTVSADQFEDYKTLMDERVTALRKAEDQRMGGLILLRVLAVSGAFGLLLSVLNSLGVHFGT